MKSTSKNQYSPERLPALLPNVGSGKGIQTMNASIGGFERSIFSQNTPSSSNEANNSLSVIEPTPIDNLIFSQNRPLTSSLREARESLRQKLDLSLEVIEHNNNDVEFVPDGLRINGDVVTYDEGFLQRISRRVKAPGAYLNQLPRKLRADLLNHHLHEITEDRIRLCLRENSVVGLGDNLLTLSAADVFDQVLSGIGNFEIESHELEISDTGFILRILTLEQRDVAVGDAVRGGLQVEHCLTGDFATRIETFIYRLVCRNGMVHRDCLAKGATRTRRLPMEWDNARDLQQEQIRRLAGETWGKLEEKLQELPRLTAKSDDISHLLSSSLRRSRLSQRVIDLVSAAWERNGQTPNRWAAINAMTEVGTHNRDINRRERRALLVLGGILSFADIHLCERCFSLVMDSRNGHEV